MEKKYTSSPWGFRYWDFERYCRFMKKIGITDVCTQFGNPEELPLVFRAEKNEIEKHIETAEKSGVRFLEINITDNYRAEIPLASLLEVKYLIVCENWEETEESFKKVSATLKDIGRLSNEYNLTVAVENHGGLMRTAAGCRKLLEEVGMENVKLNYDPANFLYFGEDPLDALDEVLPLTAFTHFKSVKYENGKPKYCRVKEGVIDYKQIFGKLLPVYDGYLGLEYEEPSDVEQGTIDDFNCLKDILIM
ncbi:MAG: sugar phosphate isomerase/epimerase [Dehalococcoidales bacterium]|nr:sugar phosphate isomerase/epimerase [Dehalococcoidales bacterium]